MNTDDPVSANPEMIKKWATRNKCWMCKHRFDKPVLLPVENPERGKFQPNFNAEILFHVFDTHGIPDDIVREWIIGSIYGMELTEFGVRK